MKSISISITTKSPLLLSQGPPAHNLTKTLDFISGNTIRGLLAHQYLSKGGQDKDDDFIRLFLSSETHFGFARIEGCQTIPLSARSCKYNDGFKNDQGGHGVIDVLLSDGEKRCEKQGCNLPIDYFEGFWNPATCTRQSVNKRLITRTAIDLVLGGASMGQLYSQQVIEEEQTFRGIIEVLEDLAGALGKLFSEDFTARIGTGRSRGQGWVEVKQEPFSLPSWGTAKERFNRFKKKVLVVTLLSDAIFHDKYLRDCTAPDISHLKSMDIELDNWESRPSLAFASSRMVFGFDGIPLQLPRVPRLAVTAGSVFLFKAKNGKEPAIPDGDGIGWIGDNNREGFGQAILWHPFHIDPEEEVVSCLVD